MGRGKGEEGRLVGVAAEGGVGVKWRKERRE